MMLPSLHLLERLRARPTEERLWLPCCTTRLYLLGRRHDLLGLEHIMRAGLLDVHVLARLAGPDGLQRMVVIGGGDRNGVDRLVFEQLAEVGIGGRLLFAVGLQLLHALVQHGLVDVAQRGDFDVGQFGVAVQVIAAATAQADAGDADSIVSAAAGAGAARFRPMQPNS